MNIVISSAMLAVAILMVAHSIGELRPTRKPERKKPKTMTSREYYKKFDLAATNLKANAGRRGGK